MQGRVIWNICKLIHDSKRLIVSLEAGQMNTFKVIGVLPEATSFKIFNMGKRKNSSSAMTAVSQ